MAAGKPTSVGAADAVNKLNSAADALSRRIGQMRAAAESGELRIDPDAGRALHTALRTQLDRVDEWMKSGEIFSQPLPLGSQWLSEAMSKKFAVRGDGSDVSLLPVLRQYRESVSDAADAIDATLRHYESTEHENLHKLRSAAKPQG